MTRHRDNVTNVYEFPCTEETRIHYDSAVIHQIKPESITLENQLAIMERERAVLQIGGVRYAPSLVPCVALCVVRAGVS